MQGKVLVVDDVEINRDVLEEILKKEYMIMKAASGAEAKDVLKKYSKQIMVVLLDLLMPEEDGYAVLDFMRENKMIGSIPVLIISSETSNEVEERCFQMGVSDFIRKPFANSQVRQRVKNIVTLFTYKNKLEQEVERQTKMVKVQYGMLQSQAEKLKQNNTRIIDVLGTVVEYRNLENGIHIERVRVFTRILAEQVAESYPEFELDERKIEMISATSAIHDIGKIAIPDSILLKPGKLLPDESEFLKSHTLRGCEIVKNIKGVWEEENAKVAYDICRNHHERYDGNGYPDGLAGEDIPISAQIVSIADAYDELISNRVYKEAYSKESAYNMLITGECGVFSPKLLECFRKVCKRLEEVVDQKAE